MRAGRGKSTFIKKLREWEERADQEGGGEKECLGREGNRNSAQHDDRG